MCVVSILFLFWKELWGFKVKTKIVNKNIKLNKSETESKMKNSTGNF